MVEKDTKIQVIIRKRPLNSKEISKGDTDILFKTSSNTLVVREQRLKVDLTKYTEEHNFAFDGVYTEEVSNYELYLNAVQPIVQASFLGAKVTCFAYGQTGSGKTYTMMGENTAPGLYALAGKDLFEYRNQSFPGIKFTVSFYEIYCNKLLDLLNDRNKLHVREDAKQSVNIVGLVQKPIDNLQNLMSIIGQGMEKRTVGQTGANDESSRSHAVLEICLKKNKKTVGKMTFIDLAGSERGADVSGSDSKTRIDGAEINKSLLALKECIRALDQEKKHLPFRGSKLTLVLKDSFIGNCRTVMIGNVSPGLSSCEHTLNTLRYSDRVKELKRGGSRDTMNPMMLPRQNSNMIKIDDFPKPPSLLYKKSGEEGKIKSRGFLSPNNTCLDRETQLKKQETIYREIYLREEAFTKAANHAAIENHKLLEYEKGMLSRMQDPTFHPKNFAEEYEKLLDYKENLLKDVRNSFGLYANALKEEENFNCLLVKTRSAFDVFDLNNDDFFETTSLY